MCADGPRKALWGKNWELRPDEERRLGTEAVGWELRPNSAGLEELDDLL